MKLRIGSFFLIFFLIFVSANASLGLLSEEVTDPYRMNNPVFSFYVQNNGSKTLEITSANLTGDLEGEVSLTEIPFQLEPSETGEISFEKKDEVSCSTAGYDYSLNVKYFNGTDNVTVSFGPFNKNIENPLVLNSDKSSMVVGISRSKNFLISVRNKGSQKISNVSFSLEDDPDFLYFIITLLEGRYQESDFESKNYSLEGNSVRDLRIEVIPKRPEEGKVTFNMDWDCTTVGPLGVNVESYTISEGVFNIKTLSGLEAPVLILLSLSCFSFLLLSKEFGK